MKQTYILENLNCAHCASKIESKIAQTEGYSEVSFNFATKRLRFESDRENTLEEIQAICDSIEEGVRVTVEDDPHGGNDHREHNHEAHGEHCHDGCCGEHEHGHDHGHEHGEGGTAKKIFLAISIVLGIAAAAVHLFAHWEHNDWIVFSLSLAATLCAGYDVFLKGFKNAFRLRIEETVLITIAVIAAFILGEYVEAAAVTILFSVGEFIEDLAVGKSRRDIEKLSQIRPDTATIMENGEERQVPAESVKAGSIIIVKPHERVPLDGVVLSGESTLDTSALTGESLPRRITEGGEALSGSINGDGLLTLKTTGEFGDSTATRILRMVEDAAAQKGTREKLITRFANIYTPVVVSLAVITAILPPLLGFGSFTEWIYKALIVLVASCPCAIVISVPLSYYSGIGAGSRMGVLIKGGKYLEALAKADCMAFDKTGTLTTGKIRVKKVYAYNGMSENEVLELAAACEQYSSHPIAQAIKEFAPEPNVRLSDYREIAGCGTSALYKGKTVSCGNSKLLKNPAPDELKDKNLVYLIYDGKLTGALEIGDTIRPEAKDILRSLKENGVKRLLMLTGDTRRGAEQIRDELGDIEYRAELMPQDKLNIIGEIQESGDTVCFVGDGINDAPVLSKSDCGIAMGLGAEAAIEAADAVLASGDLTALPKAVRLAKRTMRTVRGNITFALAVKAAVIVLAFFGIAQMWMSVLADTGVCVICVLNAARLLKQRRCHDGAGRLLKNR